MSNSNSTQEHLLDSPLVTVGVASYNNAAYLRTTLDSIRDLDYPRLQVIVVDDMSTDQSATVAKQWMADNPTFKIQFEQQPMNGGICRVLNRVLALAEGEFLTFIGSDDVWRPSFVQRLVEAFYTLGPEYSTIYGDAVAINPRGELLDDSFQRSSRGPEGNIFIDLLRENFVPAMGQLTRTIALREIGGFDENLAYEDWDIWLRLARRYQFKYLPGVVSEYRILSSSAMRNPRRYQLLIESTQKLLAKHLGVSEIADRIIHAKFAQIAREMYESGNPKARKWLRRSWWWQPTFRHGLYTIMASIGVSYNRLAAAKHQFTVSKQS